MASKTKAASNSFHFTSFQLVGILFTRLNRVEFGITLLTRHRWIKQGLYSLQMLHHQQASKIDCYQRPRLEQLLLFDDRLVRLVRCEELFRAPQKVSP